jgi:hypothetical protein
MFAMEKVYGCPWYDKKEIYIFYFCFFFHFHCIYSYPIAIFILFEHSYFCELSNLNIKDTSCDDLNTHCQKMALMIRKNIDKLL